MSLFVGREEELRALRDLLGSVVDGQSRALIVVGEPGSGKSRLLAEALAGCQLETLNLRGHQMEHGVPLSAARNMLLRLVDEPTSGAVLEELLLGEETTADSLRLFEAAHRCLMQLGPVLVVLDDTQWADSESLALVHYLLRAGSGARAAQGVLIAARPGTGVVELEEGLCRVLDVERIELGPLDRRAGVTLAQSLHKGLSEAEAALMWERAGGSPFWLEVIASGEEGEAERLVGARLERSGADASRVGALLSIASRPLPVDVIPDLLSWPTERVGVALRRLAAEGVIRTGPEGVSIFHDLLAEILRAGLPQAKARELHRILSEWMEETPEDLFATAAALAHRLASGDLAVEPALRLLENPQRRLLSDEVLELLRQVAEEAGDDGRDLRWHLAELMTERGEAASALREWSALKDQAPEGDRRARAALRAAEAAFWLHRHQETRGLLSEARLASEGDAVLAVELDAFEARLLRWVEHRPEEADVYTERALSGVLATAGRDGAAKAHSLALESAYEGATVAGDLSGMMTAAARRAELTVTEEVSLMASFDVAMCLRPLGRLEEAETKLASIWEQAQKKVLPRVAVGVGPWLAHTMLMVGRLDQAEEVAGEAVALSDRLGGTASAGVAHRTLRLVDLMKGEVRRALRDLEEELETTSPHYQIGHYQTLAWWSARLGGPEQMRSVSQYVASGMAKTEEVDCQRCRLELLLHGSEALARVGRREEAAELLAEAESVDGWAGATYEFWKGRAEAALATGSPQAVELWSETVKEGVELGMHLEALWARLDLVRELEATEGEGAVAELTALAARAAELGVVAAAREADQRLRALGVRTWRRGTKKAGDVPLDRLTDREWEIAELLAGGASNPEIASTLFISRKTVERHVSNILVKLGARNRAEVAALVAAMGGNEGAHR